MQLENKLTKENHNKRKIPAKYFVLHQANLDYNKDIASINFDEIKRLNFPNDLDQGLSEHEKNALKGMDLEESIQFLLALNSINYQYWDLKFESSNEVIDRKIGGDLNNETLNSENLNNIKPNFVRYANNELVGALACFDGFCKLWAQYKIDKDLSQKIDEKLIKQYFGDIPEAPSRIEILKESLNPELLKSASEIIISSLKKGVIDTNLGWDVAEIMVKSFKEPYLKKVQLALYEIHLQAKSLGLESTESLTVAADYQLPKVLEAMGILKYSEKLTTKINNYEILEVGGTMERAIRAATIIACEEISTQKGISIPTIDRYLWLARNNYKDKKFHLTKTTAY